MRSSAAHLTSSRRLSSSIEDRICSQSRGARFPRDATSLCRFCWQQRASVVQMRASCTATGHPSVTLMMRSSSAELVFAPNSVYISSVVKRSSRSSITSSSPRAARRQNVWPTRPRDARTTRALSGKRCNQASNAPPSVSGAIQCMSSSSRTIGLAWPSSVATSAPDSASVDQDSSSSSEASFRWASCTFERRSDTNRHA
jgi:hypothetical protein